MQVVRNWETTAREAIESKRGRCFVLAKLQTMGSLLSNEPGMDWTDTDSSEGSMVLANSKSYGFLRKSRGVSTSIREENEGIKKETPCTPNMKL